MDIYTKLFLVNFVILVFLAFLDRNCFNDDIENGKYTKHIWTIWNVTTVLSIPVWIVYLIIIW